MNHCPVFFFQVPDNKFEVKCVPPGYWDSGFTWAYCDVANPPTCGSSPDDFAFESASDLASKGISIVERKNVILGGKGGCCVEEWALGCVNSTLTPAIRWRRDSRNLGPALLAIPVISLNLFRYH